MAKRRHSNATSNSRSKRPKVKTEEDELWRIKTILKERNGRYLISWEDDEVTGKPFPNNWEPRENVNQEALDDWERQKLAKKARGRRRTALPSSSPSQPTQAPAPPAAEKQTDQPKEPSSSPAPPSRTSPQQLPTLETNDLEVSESEHSEPSSPREATPQHRRNFLPEAESPSSQIQEELAESQISPLKISRDSTISPKAVNSLSSANKPAGVVQIADPPSSYAEGAYERFTQSYEDPISSAPNNVDHSPAQRFGLKLSDIIDEPSQEFQHPEPIRPVQQLFESSQQPAGKVIPDSQSLVDITASPLFDAHQSDPNVPATQERLTQEQTVVPQTSGAETVELPQQNSPAPFRPLDLFADNEPQNKETSPQTINPLLTSKVPETTDNSNNTASYQESNPEFQNTNEEPPKSPEREEEDNSSNQQIIDEHFLSQAPEVEASSPVKQLAVEAPSQAQNSSDFTAFVQPDSAESPEKQVSEQGQEDFGSPASKAQNQPPSSVTASQSTFPFATQVAQFSGEFIERDIAPSIESPFNLASTLSQRAPGIASVHSSPIKHSSPLASLPSQTLGTLGESAPPRLATPSTPGSTRLTGSLRNMPDSPQPPKLDWLGQLLQKVKDDHPDVPATSQASAANGATAASPAPSKMSEIAGSSPALQHKALLSTIAQDNARRSPSSVPAQEAEEEVTQDFMNENDRCETLVPHEPEEGFNGRQRNGSIVNATRTVSSQQSELKEETPDFQVVPVPLEGQQRDSYGGTVRFEKKLISNFMGNPAPSASDIKAAEDFVERMRLVAMHPDLVNPETFTQYAVPPTQQVDWDVTTSSKFRFLKALLEPLRGSLLQIALLVPAGRLLTMLETFLTCIEISHRRPGSEISSDEGPHITLIPLDGDDAAENRPTDLVIAMDHTAKREFVVQRGLLHQDNKMTRLISLVVPNSVEHIDMSLSHSLSPRTRLRTLVGSIWELCDDTGNVFDEGNDRIGAEALGFEISQCVLHQDQEWSIPTIGPLEDLDSQTQSESVNGESGENDAASATPLGKKRGLEAEADEESHKKTRMDESSANNSLLQVPSTVNLQDVEITRISDSLDNATQAGSSAVPGSSLSTTELQLQALLTTAQNRVAEHEQALSDLQYRFEEQREKIIETKRMRDAAIETATRATARMTDQANSLSAIKAERNTLREQFAEAQASLLIHEVPERAELEAVKQEAAQAKIDKEKAEARLKAAKEETEYIRDKYQESSSSAEHLARQNTSLESQLVTVQDKLNAEFTKLRQMSYDAQGKNSRDEIKRLKALVRDREAGLKVRDDELARMKEASRGRMGTRGTSLPRTPRLGSPMKLDGAGRGRGSRQTSPAMGDVRGRAGAGPAQGNGHPLRNG